MDFARPLVNHEGPAVQRIQAQVRQARADLGQGRVVEPAGADHARQFRPHAAQFGRRRPGLVPAVLVETTQPSAFGVHLQPRLALGARRQITEQRAKAPAVQGVSDDLARPDRRRQVDDLASGARHAERQGEAHVLGPVVEDIVALGLGQKLGQLSDPIGIEGQNLGRQGHGRHPVGQLQRPGGDQAASHVVGRPCPQHSVDRLGRHFEIPMGCGLASLLRGRSSVGVHLRPVVGRQARQHGMEGGDVGGQMHIHVRTMARCGWRTFKGPPMGDAERAPR